MNKNQFCVFIRFSSSSKPQMKGINAADADIHSLCPISSVSQMSCD